MIKINHQKKSGNKNAENESWRNSDALSITNGGHKPWSHFTHTDVSAQVIKAPALLTPLLRQALGGIFSDICHLKS